MFSDEDVEAFGRAVGREILSGEYRNNRGVTV